MAGNSNIRITQKDRAEYKRLVKNTRAKINRIDKKYGVNVSGEVSLPKLEDFKTRKQFNEWKQQQRDFTNIANLDYQYVKNEHGVVISKRDKFKMEVQARDIQRSYDRRKKELSKIDFHAGGRVQGGMKNQLGMLARPKIGQFGRIGEFNFDNIKDKRDLDYKKSQYERLSDKDYYNEKVDEMMDNWLKKLSEVYGEDGKELYDKVSKMDRDDFYQVYLTHEEFNFDYFYPIEGLEVDEGDTVGLLSNYIDNFYDNYDDNDLTIF